MKIIKIIAIKAAMFITAVILRIVLLVSLIVSVVFWGLIIIFCGQKRFAVTLIFAGAHILGIPKPMRKFFEHYDQYYGNFK